MRTHRRRRVLPFLATGLLLGLALCLLPAPARALVNSASGSFGATPLDLSAATVNLNRIVGNAVTTATAEVNPGSVLTSRNLPFTVSVLPQISPGNTGFNQVTITVPAGYGNLAPSAVRVNGAPLPAGSCPAPGAGAACASVAGNVVTVLFGDRIDVDGSRVDVVFTALTPATSGSDSFAVSVDETTLPAPPQVATAGDADLDPASSNSLTVVVSAGVDPDRSTLVAIPEVVMADGIASANLIVTLVDAAGQPVANHLIALSSDRGGLDVITPTVTTDAGGRAIGTISSLSPGVATVSAVDTTDGIPLNQRASVAFTQGEVLHLSKSADKRQLQVGDLVGYGIDVANLTGNAIVDVDLNDLLPPHFTYRAGSARLDGVPIADPPAGRTLSFPLGTVEALVDSNGNGQADPGEPGFHRLTYQLIANAGATPGSYRNSAWATDVCSACPISNRASASVEIVADPLFDLATIIGKVFADRDEDGLQDADEEGLGGVMVALDDGTYVLTDTHGRYHFPAVEPGERLVKVNLQGLGNGAAATTFETRIAHLTPGLLAKINFGVTTRLEQSQIGKPAEYGVAVDSLGRQRPIDAIGSLNSDRLLLNGAPLRLPGGDVALQFSDLDDVVQIEGGELQEPVIFAIRSDDREQVRQWQLSILDADDAPVHTFAGESPPPAELEWNGRLDSGELLAGGAIYQYQMRFTFADGSERLTPRRLFGVDRVSAIAVNLTGSAFAVGSDQLSAGARQALDEAAQLLRRYPLEKVVIEGYTDATGGAQANLELSKRRAQAALDYLVDAGELPAERFVVVGYGEERPLASNLLPEGRELNRRVEIKGDYRQVERARLLDQYRSEAQIRLNDAETVPNGNGRFRLPAVQPQDGTVQIAIDDGRGGRRTARVAIPECRILEPGGATVLPFHCSDPDGFETAAGPDATLDEHGTVVRTWLRGETAPDAELLLDGTPLAVDADGRFAAPLALRAGRNRVSLLVRNPAGITRLADLDVQVATRTDSGELVILSEAVPFLSVQMPPTDRPLDSETFVLSGVTEAGNQVAANSRPLTVDGSGHFSTTLTLPQGQSQLRIVVTDPQGRSGSIERTVTVSDTRLFLLAFADGRIGQNIVAGSKQSAGVDEKLVSEGRVALYLKGTIAGRYLITAALDTGRGEPDELFSNLDATASDRLLTNLDPDKLYPVYGDDSTLVHDAESQGKLYLALNSDELHLLVGNRRIDLAGGELATWRRTLFAASARYESREKSRYGAANTEVELFGAEVRQVHVRDELAATGGALYYLSRKELIEGSEQVTLVVRDALTGLTLARIPQEQNSDYSIRYDQGRLLFRQPVASVRSDARLIDQATRSGNPVFIEIDYEARADSFEQNAAGGRVRQQLGDHVAIGATGVDDRTDGGDYRLYAVDGELRFGKGTRLLVEYAQSDGAFGATNRSLDGGITWTTVSVGNDEKGRAWKAAADFDIGEWYGAPGQLRLNLYHKQLDDAYRAMGHDDEAGTRKSGAGVTWRPGSSDTLAARFDRQQNSPLLAGTTLDLDTYSLHWRHSARRWRLLGEYRLLTSTPAGGARSIDEHLAALRLEIDATERLTVWAEQQQTLSGPDNSQSSLGADYRPLDNLSLHARGTEASNGRSAEAGIGVHFDQSRLYLDQRLQQETASHTLATVLGGETTAGPAGSRLYSEYQWLRTQNDSGRLALTGIEKSWTMADGLRLSLGGEYSVDDRADTTWRRTVTAGIAYNRNDRLKLSSRAELRRDSGGSQLTQWLVTGQGRGKLGDDFALLGMLRFSRTENRVSGAEEAGFSEMSAGLAYRPVAHDIFNALGRVSHLEQRSVDAVSGLPQRQQLDSVAFEWSLQLLPALEWVKKDAIRWKQDQADGASYSTCSWLSLHRLNLHLFRNFDAGLEYRMLTERLSASNNQGWLTEVGWRPQRHFRFAVGYNFTDFSDDERSFNDYSVYGWFLRAQGMY